MKNLSPVIQFFLDTLAFFYKKFSCDPLFPLLFFLACFLIYIVNNPGGAINQFLIHAINVIHPIFPSTPNNWKIGYLLSQFALEFPWIGWGVIFEIFSTIAGMLSLFLFVKLYKLVPFI